MKPLFTNVVAGFSEALQQYVQAQLAVTARKAIPRIIAGCFIITVLMASLSAVVFLGLQRLMGILLAAGFPEPALWLGILGVTVLVLSISAWRLKKLFAPEATSPDTILKDQQKKQQQPIADQNGKHLKDKIVVLAEQAMLAFLAGWQHSDSE